MFIKYPLHTIAVLLSVSLSLAAPVQADPPKDKGKGTPSSGKGDWDVDLDFSAMITAGISFGDARKLAVDYGLTGQKPLPPGIRKNLARGKPMPPGIAKTRMPDSFVDHLPEHQGYEWQLAGSDLVLVVSGTLVISDILKGVFD